jgi:hypothetical protein
LTSSATAGVQTGNGEVILSEITAVPEPGAFGTGALGLLLVALRRKTVH